VSVLHRKGRGGEEHVASELIDQARSGEALASVGSAGGARRPEGWRCDLPRTTPSAAEVAGDGEGKMVLSLPRRRQFLDHHHTKGGKELFFFCKVPLRRKTVRSSIPHPAAKKSERVGATPCGCESSDGRTQEFALTAGYERRGRLMRHRLRTLLEDCSLACATRAMRFRIGDLLWTV
jgi:hypothetical protein